MQRSEEMFERARRSLPGGVNSPVRAFRAVGGTPPFIVRGEGPRIYDLDGRGYIDYVGSWGPLILGHGYAPVIEAVEKAAREGLSFGAPTPGEVELAERICAALPSVEMVRLVNSGTEAVMSAIRLARGFTGRDDIVKFVGCYHGHADGLLVKAGSGATTFGEPDSAGIPADYARHTLLAPFNDLDAVAELFSVRGGTIAAILLEPVAGNMGVIPPAPGFLEGLRRLADEHGALLVFDEVMTGFRVGWQGAQGRYGVTPDLTTLGKVIGGGMPIGAYGGRREIMEKVSPLGPVYQAGTLSGNPVAVAAGLATLNALDRPGTYERLETLGARLAEGIEAASRSTGVPVCVQRVGSMLTAFFLDHPVTDYASATKADTVRFSRVFHALLQQGVYPAPSQFEALFVSLAHTEAEIDETVQAFRQALATLEETA